MADNQNESTPVVPVAALTKAEIIKNISAVLAQRRQVRNIPIEKVYESTKIRPQTLLALEKGNWHELPGEVYVRGFLTRYAQFLGLQPQELLNPYFELVNQVEPNPKGDARNSTALSESSKLPWIWGGLGILVFIGVIKFVGSHLTSSHKTPSQPEVAIPVVAVSTAAVTTVPAAVILTKHRVTVFTPNELWLKVVSETKTFEGIVPQNSTWTFVGEGKIGLLFGHTRDVIAHYDGQSLNVTESQKRSYQFNDH